MKLELEILKAGYAVSRLPPRALWPEALRDAEFFSLTLTAEELSIVCREDQVPKGARCEYGWRCFKVKGPLGFNLTGVLASLAAPLAAAGISIFSVSTFDTDHILVKQRDLAKAVQVLRAEGNLVAGLEPKPSNAGE